MHGVEGEVGGELKGGRQMSACAGKHMNLDLIGQLGESIEQCLDCRAKPREFGSVVTAILAVIGGDQRETHGEGGRGCEHRKSKRKKSLPPSRKGR
jgi:hypothetical protein